MGKTFTVIYKKGSKWHKVPTKFQSRETARKKELALIHKGYDTLIHDTDRLNSIGMPD